MCSLETQRLPKSKELHCAALLYTLFENFVYPLQIRQSLNKLNQNKFKIVRIRIRNSFISKCVCTHKEFVLVLRASSTERTNIVQTTYNQGKENTNNEENRQ